MEEFRVGEWNGDLPPGQHNSNGHRRSTNDQEAGRCGQSWQPIDLGPYLRGEIQPPAPPSLGLARSDGVRLIYPSREHVVVGETESGKSWFVLACTAAELLRGNPVVYVHYEEPGPESTIERLRDLGVPDKLMLRPLFRFVAPNEPAQLDNLADLLDPAPTLVIHDGVNEAMTLNGHDILAAEGAALFRRRLIAPFLRAGAATIACDHLPGGADGTRKNAYGSVHKGNAIDGARIALENREPFGRDRRGRSNVYVTKDRPGHLRKHGSADRSTVGKTYLGTLVVDASDPFKPLDLAFYAATPEDTAATADLSSSKLADTIWEVTWTQLPDHRVKSKRALYALMRDAGQSFREADASATVHAMLASGRLISDGANAFTAAQSAAQDGEA
ncbi:hypothetical protein A5692_11625 [Mycobacterium sp. E342]|nr:hypothetical protein A5692_11625 [Mycobacterium sp. E342]